MMQYSSSVLFQSVEIRSTQGILPLLSMHPTTILEFPMSIARIKIPPPLYRKHSCAGAHHFFMITMHSFVLRTLAVLRIFAPRRIRPMCWCTTHFYDYYALRAPNFQPLCGNNHKKRLTHMRQPSLLFICRSNVCIFCRFRRDKDRSCQPFCP